MDETHLLPNQPKTLYPRKSLHSYIYIYIPLPFQSRWRDIIEKQVTTWKLELMMTSLPCKSGGLDLNEIGFIVG